jgi:Leucine-rich repeat (LRR) protein
MKRKLPISPSTTTTANKKQRNDNESTSKSTPLWYEIESICRIVIDYLNTVDWIQFSYVSKYINKFKYDESCMIGKRRTLRVNPRISILETARYWSQCPPATLSNLKIMCTTEVLDLSFVYLKSTKILDIQACNAITERAFKHLESVTSLNISSCLLLSDIVLKGLPELVELNISDCRMITDNGVGQLKKLKYLSMKGTTQVTPSVLKQLPLLEELEISGSKFQDDSFEGIENITALTLCGCSNLTDKCFEYLPKLRRLELSECRGFTDKCSNYFIQLQELNVLDRIGQFSDQFFQPLEQLISLTICYCRVTDEAFTSMKHLKNLCLMYDRSGNNKCELTEAIFNYLPELRVLDMKGIDMSQLITDKVNLSNIRQLKVDGKRIVSKVSVA